MPDINIHEVRERIVLTSPDDGADREKFMYTVEELADRFRFDAGFRLVEINLTEDQNGQRHINFVAERPR